MYHNTPYFMFGSALAARRAATVSAESSLSATNIRLVNPSYASPKIIVIEVHLILCSCYILHNIWHSPSTQKNINDL